MSYTIELKQDPHRHYCIDGKWSVGRTRIAGVTAVLGGESDALARWAAGQAWAAVQRLGGPADIADLAYAAGCGPDAVRDAAAQRGHDAHSAFEYLCRGESPPDVLVTGASYPHVSALERVVRELGLGGGTSECPVGSRRHVYAGTFDYFEGGTLYDVKTGRQSWTHVMQLAAYEVARREMGMAPAKDLITIYTNDTGGYHCQNARELGGYANARRQWLATLKLYRVRMARTTKIAKLLETGGWQ